MMEAGKAFKTFVHFYQTIRHSMPEYRNVHCFNQYVFQLHYISICRFNLVLASNSEYFRNIINGLIFVTEIWRV